MREPNKPVPNRSPTEPKSKRRAATAFGATAVALLLLVASLFAGRWLPPGFAVARAVDVSATTTTSIKITVPSTTTTSSSTTFMVGFGTTSTTLEQVMEGECGDARGDGGVTASDALVVLRAAVGLQSCHVCICDTDDSGAVTAIDALRALAFAVGQAVTLACPPC